MDAFDWNDLRFFLNLVRAGSYQGAARRLRVDHTTVRRRIAALEEALQASLFVAQEQSPVLTAEGQEMLRYAEGIEALAEQASEKLKGTDNEQVGTVRIGVLDGFGTYFLTPRLKLLLDRHPALKIELVVLSRLFNLSNREADIAIAPAPPQQRRLIVRKLTDTRLFLYASGAYLEENPVESLKDVSSRRLVTYVPELVFSPEMDYLNFIDTPILHTFEATNVITQIEAVASGIGIGVLPNFMASRFSHLQRVLPEEFSLNREYWLVAHPDTINIARIRIVVDFLVAEVKANQALFLGEQ
jgi:DNA-binding transcriptional LysR family regulator